VNSIILTVTARVLGPVLLLFSLFVLFRGHQEPGGGFAGGLLAASAFSIRAIRKDVELSLPVEPHALIGTGLLLAVSSGLASVVLGRPFMTAIWFPYVSTVLLFDIGVYLTVMGVVLMTVYALAEEKS
jgi:multicomponent Na+:H+ antiporter subunit B